MNRLSHICMEGVRSNLLYGRVVVRMSESSVII
jgi:hypothetical protein